MTGQRPYDMQVIRAGAGMMEALVSVSAMILHSGRERQEMITWPSEIEAKGAWLLQHRDLKRDPTRHEIVSTQCIMAMNVVPNLSDHGVIMLLIKEVAELNERVEQLETRHGIADDD